MISILNEKGSSTLRTKEEVSRLGLFFERLAFFQNMSSDIILEGSNAAS